jgi:chromosome segregation ATPase
MKAGIAFVFAILVLPAAHASSSSSPVTKVLELLSNLQAKIIAEGTDAQKTYAEYAEWCEDRSKDLAYAIKTGKADVNDLKATIEQEAANIASLDAQIEQLSGDIATDEADLAAATEIRGKEHAAFLAEEKELVEVVDTLGRAATIIEREMQKGGASMLQLHNAGNIAQAMAVMMRASAITSTDASRLTALLQSSDEDSGAPAGAVYTSQSGDILATLADLREKAEGQLADARDKETKSVNAFELLKQSLEDEIKFGNNDMAKAKKSKGASAEKKAVAEGDLDVTSKDLASDEQALADLHHECMTSAQDFEASTKSRGEELDALAHAKKAIADNTGAAAELSYGLDQIAFLQMARVASSADLAKFEAARLVRELARKDGSVALSQLASKMLAVSGDDVFAKVKGLISAMIEKLTAEGEADATHKAWCDKELAESNEKHADRTAEINKLSTKIDQISARSAKLKEQVAELSKELAALAASQVEMDKLRQEENAAFKTNSADMEQGLKGVKIALKVLRDYYAKDKAHDAADGEATGIVGLLEVVESDFTKGLAEMTATEESAAAAYDKQTKENEIEKTTKSQDVKYKNKEAANLDKATAEASSDRAGVQAELDAVNEYLKELHDQCDEKVESYEETVRRRDAELAGLKEALEILDGQSFLQKKTQRTLKIARPHV